MSQHIEKSELSTVPESWPGAFGVYRYSKAAILFNWKTLVGAIIVSLAVSLVLTALDPSMYSEMKALTGPQTALTTLLNVVLAAASVFLSISMTIIILSNISRVQVRLIESFKQSLGYFLNFFLMAILQSVIVSVSLLLFIVPFFFVMPRLMLAPYFIVDQKLGPIEATKASWKATRGHAGKVWGIIGATVLMALLMVTVIGIPFAVYFLVMYAAAYGLLYKYVVSKAPQPES